MKAFDQIVNELYTTLAPLPDKRTGANVQFPMQRLQVLQGLFSRAGRSDADGGARGNNRVRKTLTTPLNCLSKR